MFVPRQKLELEKLTQLRIGTPLYAMIELFRTNCSRLSPARLMPGAGPFRATVLL